MIDKDNFYRYYDSARFRKILWLGSATLAGMLVFMLVWGLYAWVFIGRIPGVKKLGDFELQADSRLHSNDGSIIKDVNDGSRIVVPIDYIPKLVQDAFISAEDQRFYEHGGIDFIGIGRAVVRLVPSLLSGRRPEGASTITQQVARNIVLNSSDLSVFRKFNEIVVALKLERSLDKKKILELYLNQIFLGNRSYGVSVAAQNYFHKNLDQLSTDQIAFLAALPKGPNNYNPTKFYDAAITRRNWVIDRMYQMGFIGKNEREQASAKSLEAFVSNEASVNSDYFVDNLRQELQQKFPKIRMVGGGYSIRTTLDNRVQLYLVQALHKSLRDYDRRHGFRGPLKLSPGISWQSLSDIPADGRLADWLRAVVVNDNGGSFSIALENGERGRLTYANAAMGREYYEDKVDKSLSNKEIAEVVQSLPIGSVILVSPLKDNDFLLEQIPAIEGAAIAVDPKTGRVLGEVGGWSYDRSKFNRVSQANRQPGSSIKPFVYLAALENGVSPFATVANSEVMVETPSETWIPDNFDNDEAGGDSEESLRYGLEHSLNRMTVRVAQAIGFNKVGGLFQRLGIYDKQLNYPSMVLGGADTQLERLVRAYAILANYGKSVDLVRFDRVQDRYGKTLARSDNRLCNGCQVDNYNGQSPPTIPDDRKSLINPQLAYIIIDMMQGVVYRGTGAQLAELGLNIAGKTGTTSNNQDSLFVGLLPDIVVGVWTGFDKPTTLGRNPVTGAEEAGSTLALPVVKNFMQNYKTMRKPQNFYTPTGIVKVRMKWDDWQPGYTGKTVLQPATKDMVNKASQEYFNSGYTIESGDDN
ncbi:MAG: PBP1A family penicillin-binding protein [Hydrotalea sp.]|nr:PBP1A family penicillin-binding protein [Hydrotalea sp.]